MSRTGGPPIASRYVDGSYLDKNPDWHVADSAWKAAQVLAALGGYCPAKICEVGCGAGEILRVLHDRWPETVFVGYDVSPIAIELARSRSSDRLTFELGDAADSDDTFDLMLVMDVIEHVPDPVAFLRSIGGKSKRTMLHIPLDLCALSVVRAEDLLEKRESLGHLHYFTPETALAVVNDAGFRVTGSTLTRSWEIWPRFSTRGRLARRILPPRAAVRLVGGYSILVTAENPLRAKSDNRE